MAAAAPPPEEIAFTPEQKEAYDAAAAALLKEPAAFFGPIPKVVSVDDHIQDDVVTLITPSRGHHELFRALEQLGGLEKEEQTVVRNTQLSRVLTELVTGETYTTPQQAIESLEILGQAVPRRVCQHPFKKNDIVWVCRTCQADETCVLCHACYTQSDHEKHDVAFYHAQAGGCCDCGDPDAWNPAGFCPHHGPGATVVTDQEQSALSESLVNRVRGAVPSCVDWLVQHVAANAETAYARANPSVKRLHKMHSQVAESSHTAELMMNRNIGGIPPPHRSLSVPDEMEVDEDEEEADIVPVDTRAHVFSPTAASSSSSESASRRQEAAAAAEALGATGRAGHGLYIVLHADDIHSKQQLVDALRDFLGTSTYYTDKLLDNFAKALLQFGQLVIFGTQELVSECGATQVHLWMDGDKVASGRIGAVILERASCLTRHGMFCSILTRDELILEQRAVAVLQWLSAVSQSCDPLCSTVAECILPNRHLVPLLRADFKMSARVTKAWYSLLLTLLAVPTFKSHLAAAYCDTYRAVTAKYARGMGVLERSGYTLSVQFLNRVTYVINLVQERDLLGKLGKSLLETLQVASQSHNLNGRLNPNHFVLTHRRYSPCVSDLKCVLNVKGMARVVACKGGTFLGDWISALSLAQFMDPQVWQDWELGHVELESRGWVGAFNASISFGSLFERLLGWADDETSPITDPNSPLSRDLMPCVELTFQILVKGVDKWQRSEMIFYEPTPFTSSIASHRQSPASLAFSTISAKHGTALAMRQMSVAQVSPFSFHLPLHRFVAGCLRELCLRKNSDEGGISDLLRRLRTQLSTKQQDELFQGLMEFPALVLSRAAQVRANLWRRNGRVLDDQVLNYNEPPFCRNMRDADLLMTQFATIGRTLHLTSDARPESDVGMSFLVNLMLHRLGVFDFVGLGKAPTWNISRYFEEVAEGLYPAERRAPGSEKDDSPLPWNFSPSREASSSMLLLEEFLHFMIIFITELPPVVPNDKEEQTRQAKFRLLREVIHRLASGSKTHSELSEVHHVLSHWDNVLLSAEGKLLNPDDATGAALEKVLEDIADKVNKGKMEPSKWEMRQSSWDSYDPSFFHINLRSHQTAAEERPKPSEESNAPFGWEAKPYAPALTPAHPFFERLRRDATADATVLAVAYRVLHLHCRADTSKSLFDLRGRLLYEKREKSETALARTVQLLTLGVYAWRESRLDDSCWRDKGGGSVGSIFFNRGDADTAPTVGCWVKEFLLAEPQTLLDCEWYNGEENALVLLHRLAVSGGSSGEFIAQDAAVRSGAAWLCEFALSCCPEAGSVISPAKRAAPDSATIAKTESEFERRKKMAMERAMAKMKAQAAKAASQFEMEIGSEDESEKATSQDFSAPSTPNHPIRKTSFGSGRSSASSTMMLDGNDSFTTLPSFVSIGDEESNIPPRLRPNRPRCIICNDEDGAESRCAVKADNNDGEGQRKKSRRRTENALGFVGYCQASTVLKGGGGPPTDLDSPMAPVREFVGTHVALCGHAVHSECCESYLASVTHREDRQIGKRDEFRCPLCQRLSNCLVPFIDVGLDWIGTPAGIPESDNDAAAVDAKKSGDEMEVDLPEQGARLISLQDFLASTPWWVTRHDRNVAWDGHSAFVERIAVAAGEDDGMVVRKPSRRLRSLKKKDLYAAWNAMMRTPRFVRRKLRRTNSRTAPSEEGDEPSSHSASGEDSIGETVVWRRFMEQISDISYRADSKRLGDDHLHNLFGEFRHYIVEKYAYNMANRFEGNEPADWPSCMFNEILSDNTRQEMSREKLLSKLLLSIQSFTYSCCSEAFDARRAFRKLSSSSEVARKNQDTNLESFMSGFGISDVICEGRMILMPRPSPNEEGKQEVGEAWPFDGRLGRLRYFGLTVMAAAGAVAADLVQLVLQFPLETKESDPLGVNVKSPERAPIAYPILFGNVLTHVVAAMCATCGRARARSDSLEVVWPTPFSARGSFVFSEAMGNVKTVESAVEDCEGFLKLGLMARMLQVLLGRLEISTSGAEDQCSRIASLRSIVVSAEGTTAADTAWMKSCLTLLEIAVSGQNTSSVSGSTSSSDGTLEQLRDACSLAASAAISFLADAGTIFQVIMPCVVSKFQNNTSVSESSATSNHAALEKMLVSFNLEPIDAMLQSQLAREIIANWFDSASRHGKASVQQNDANSLQSRLYRTQGFRVFDWPSTGLLENSDRGWDNNKESDKAQTTSQQLHAAPSSGVQMLSVPSASRQASTTADILRTDASPTLLTFNSKKSVSLLGGFTPDALLSKSSNRPRVAVIPTSYTDLYAELGSLMPDCEQTAVCLICGEVLDAGGKGECTRHSYKCGAGAGMFFLLQECSGLIMHKSKAAYIHSPYVDSHGETPQYRGRPLNLDLERYEHLREVWFSHGVRSKVVKERGGCRQIILQDFY